MAVTSQVGDRPGVRLPRMTLAFEHPGFAPDLVDYRTGLELQRRVHGEVLAGTFVKTPSPIVVTA